MRLRLAQPELLNPNMHILFLDTETSGLSSYSDAIIEIAAVIVEFDPSSTSTRIVETFDSLVQLDTVLDDKITRITGISHQDLSQAPRRTIVQEKWQKWLTSHHDPEETLLICGHSIGFDLGFMTNGQWYLPSRYSAIDTLDLVKILSPDSSAVNLEFLIKRFDLDPARHTRLKEHVQGLEAHRALYDTYASYLLFTFLLDRFLTLPLPRTIAKLLADTFWKLPLTLYEQKLPSETKIFSEAEHNLSLDLDGSVVESFSTRIHSFGRNTHLDFVSEGLFSTSKVACQRVLLQLYIAGVFRRLYPEKSLKFHARDTIDFELIKCVLDHCVSLDSDSNQSTPTRIGHIDVLEDYIARIQTATHHQFPLGKLVTLIELYLSFSNLESSSPISIHLHKLISAYDFFLLSLQSFLTYNEYIPDPYATRPESIQINEKFSELLQLVTQLPNLNENCNSEFCLVIINNITQLILESKEIPQYQFHFKVYKQNIAILWPKKHFNLQSHFESISTSYTQLIINSYLSSSDLEVAQNCLSLEQTAKIKYNSLYTPYNLTIKGKSSPQNIVNGYEANHYPILLISGKNQAYNTLKDYLLSQLPTKDTLIVGEGGSVSKITSKLRAQFTGIVLLKVHEADYVSRSFPELEIQEVYLLMEPYLFLKEPLKSLPSQTTNQLSQLYTRSLCNKFFTKWKKPITFIHNITS